MLCWEVLAPILSKAVKIDNKGLCDVFRVAASLGSLFGFPRGSSKKPGGCFAVAKLAFK